MAERLLISKLVRTENARADLYGRGHRYKDMTLFDLSDLIEMGIDPRELPIGEEIPCRFWAHYTNSEKLNSSGNPYKDVLSLERIDLPATTTSTDTSAILAELRAIKALLLQLVTGSQDPQPPNPLADTLPRPLTKPEQDLFADVAELHAPLPDPDPDLTPHAARQAFYTCASQAMSTGTIGAQRVNELVRGANGSGWANALALLQHALQGATA